MTKRFRTSLSSLVFLIASVSLVLLLNRCGGSNGGGSGSGDFALAYSGSYDAPATVELNLLDSKVNFTLSWDEKDNVINGKYEDDHFATTAGTVSGSVDAEGVRTMTITLTAPVDGVSAFVVTTEKISGTISDSFSIAKLSAQGPDGVLIFEKSGITVTALKTGTDPKPTDTPVGPAPEGDAGIYFSEIAGTYDYFAKNSNGLGNGETWTHGKKYQISVGTDGITKIASDGEEKILTYGSNPADSYTKYDHEEYAIYQVDAKTQVFAQRQAADKAFFFTYRIDGGAFWAFKKDDPGAYQGKLGILGVGYAVGTFKHKVTFAYPETATDYAVNDAVEIVIADNGAVSGTFGQFPYVDGDTSLSISTSNGIPGATITYYSPDAKTYPQKALGMYFENSKWDHSTLTIKASVNDSGKAYSVTPEG